MLADVFSVDEQHRSAAGNFDLDAEAEEGWRVRDGRAQSATSALGSMRLMPPQQNDHTIESAASGGIAAQPLTAWDFLVAWTPQVRWLLHPNEAMCLP